MAFIDRFAHENGIIKNAIRAPNTAQLDEWLSILDPTWTVLPMTGTDEFRAELAFNFEDWLYNASDLTFHLKPAGVWISAAGATIDPALSTDIYWTVTGTLPPDFTEPVVNDVCLSRSIVILYGQTGTQQVESPPQGTFGSLQVCPSGVLSSGVTNAINFDPNSVPGIYTFNIQNDHELWREVSFDLTASGASGSPVVTGTQIGTWNLQIIEESDPDVWRIHRGTNDIFTANGRFLGVDLEAGEMVLVSGGNISVKNKFGTETFIDLLALDNSMDFIMVGSGSAINIETRGEDSSLNMLAESGTINMDAIQSDIFIAATGTSRMIHMDAIGSGTQLDFGARGEDSKINIEAVGDETFIELTAQGDSSVIELDAAGDGSSIQLEANGGSSSFIELSATAANSEVRLIGEHIKIAPETDGFLIDLTTGEAVVDGGNDFSFDNGSITIEAGTRFFGLGSIELDNSEKSLYLPQRTNSQLVAENPGAGGAGRIAWNDSFDSLQFWDGGTWQTVVSGAGGAGITAVVEDTTPQLGGNLDAQGLRIDDAATVQSDFFSAGDGTLSAPSYTFTADSGTGMFRAAGGDFRLVSAGSNRLTVTTSLNVGADTQFRLSGISDGGKDALSALDRSLIFNTTSGTINVYDGTSWEQVAYDSQLTSVSGHLQNQISGGAGVDSLNSLTGDLDIVGKGEVAVTVEGTNIVVSGTPHTAGGGGGGGEQANALEGADGITVTSGTSVDTITGFRTEFVNASGTLQTQIDSNTSDISTNSSNITTNTTNISTNASDIAALLASGIADEANLVSVSGHLQSEIDATQPDVDSFNGLTGDVTVTGVGTVSTLTSGQNVTVSGSLRIRETDSDPLVDQVTEIIVTTGTLVDLGGGTVQIATGGGAVDILARAKFEEPDPFTEKTFEHNLGDEHVSFTAYRYDGCLLNGVDSVCASGLNHTTVTLDPASSGIFVFDVAKGATGEPGADGSDGIDGIDGTDGAQGEPPAVIGGGGITVTSGSPGTVTVSGFETGMIPFHALLPENDQTYYLISNAKFEFSVENVSHETETGSIDFTVAINGTPIEGLDNLSSTTSETTSYATSAKDVSLTDSLTVVTSGAGATDWRFTIETRLT